ncbi:ribosomal protein L7/L12 [Streptomyces sp. P1-3]|uniref:ribosomal protein L7/L12 n=1 Tax=Streptomyces sp. P1-3 TaxID=3421658 RepID=UPI003D364AFD
MEIMGLFFVALVVIGGIAGVDGMIKHNGRRIARVERKIDLILDHLGLREHDPELERVAELARNGRKIQAIKAYREVTGAGLKEAKDAVDRMA